MLDFFFIESSSHAHMLSQGSNLAIDCLHCDMSHSNIFISESRGGAVVARKAQLGSLDE